MNEDIKEWYKNLAKSINIEDYKEEYKKEAKSIKEDISDCNYDYEVREIISENACKTCKTSQCNYCDYYYILTQLNDDDIDDM